MDKFKIIFELEANNIIDVVKKMSELKHHNCGEQFHIQDEKNSIWNIDLNENPILIEKINKFNYD